MELQGRFGEGWDWRNHVLVGAASAGESYTSASFLLEGEGAAVSGAQEGGQGSGFGFAGSVSVGEVFVRG